MAVAASEEGSTTLAEFPLVMYAELHVSFLHIFLSLWLLLEFCCLLVACKSLPPKLLSLLAGGSSGQPSFVCHGSISSQLRRNEFPRADVHV